MGNSLGPLLVSLRYNKQLLFVNAEFFDVMLKKWQLKNNNKRRPAQYHKSTFVIYIYENSSILYSINVVNKQHHSTKCGYGMPDLH